MKTKGPFNYSFLFLILCISLLWMKPSSSIFGSESEKVRVTFVVGKVFLHKGSKKSKLKNRVILTPGDRITTGKRSRVHFQYGSSHEVRVGPNAEVKVNSRKMPRENLLMVVYGKIRVGGKARKSKGLKPFKVVTPTSVCAVRGTDFELGVANDGSTATRLDEGNINLSSGDNNVDLEGKGSAANQLGGSPNKGSYKKKSVDNMISRQDKAAKKEPGKVADGYNSQNEYFREQSKNNAKAADNLSGSVNTMSAEKSSKDDVVGMEQKAAKIENRTEDDYYRNEVQTDALTRVLNTFAKDKKAIYDKFEQVRKESNKVAEVQQKNLENIRRVREMFEKKKAEIFGKFQDTRNQILKDLEKNKSGTKPSFDFKKK